MEVIRLVYWLGSDTFHSDDVWGVLAGGRPDLEDRLQAAYCRLMSQSSHLLTNGYLTEQKALEGCRGRRAVLDLLCTAVLDRPPLIHRPGDDCACLGDAWVAGYAFRIHAFLKRNPARAEVERNKAMKADRRDARLRALVFERDGGCCRYCRSGPLPPNAGRSKDRRKVRSFDHLHPERPAGPNGEGYVTACDRCNADKGARTPAEADMVLLREPTAAERAAWLARDLQLLDRPDPATVAPEDRHQDRSENASQTRTDRVSDRDPDRERDRVPDAIADRHPDDNTTGEVCPDQGDNGTRSRPAPSPNPSGSGRGGPPGAHTSAGPPAQAEPAREPAAPDIYSRRSRAPGAGPDPPADPPYPGPPDYRWPAGSVPAEPRRRSPPDDAPLGS